MLDLRRSALVAGVTAALFAAAWTPAAAVSMPAPLGPCGGPECPSSYPPPHNGDFAGRDSNLNIFVGGDYSVVGRAAEAEGRIVTLGNFTVDKSEGGGAFNMSVVGVGSRVPPPTGSDFVVVGGNVDVEPNNQVLVGGSDSTTTAWGDFPYGGTTTGTVNMTPDGTHLHDPAAAAPYIHLRPVIEELSTCTGKAEATGTVTVTNSDATFAGDGHSSRQVFNVDRDLGTSEHPIGLVFTGIPTGATVIVNMQGTDPVIKTYSGTGLPGDQLTELRPKLLWNFPNATTAHITGGAQFQGSILAGKPGGVTTLGTAGINGRVYLAGSLVQEGVGGYELHAYPFDGDLPDCTTPTPKPSDSTSSSPAPSHSPTHPVSPEPSHTTHRPHPRPSGGATLPDTGQNGTGLLLGTAGALLVGGFGVRVLVRRRGRHS